MQSDIFSKIKEPVFPTVRLDGDGTYKFVVATVSREASRAVLVRAYKSARFHSDIMDMLQQEVGQSYGTHCDGGGKLRLDSTAKTIDIWGESTVYHIEPDRAGTVALIQQAFPDYTVREIES